MCNGHKVLSNVNRRRKLELDICLQCCYLFNIVSSDIPLTTPLTAHHSLSSPEHSKRLIPPPLNTENGLVQLIRVVNSIRLT